MKTLILYKTKYGSTKQYAEWLHEELGDSDIKNINDFDADNLNGYEQIILGSCVYMGQIRVKKFLVSNWDILKEKKVYLFMVGMSPWENKDTQEGFKTIPQEIRDGLFGYTKLPGRMDLSKLNFFEKLINKMVSGGKADDKVDRELLRPILEKVRG